MGGQFMGGTYADETTQAPGTHRAPDAAQVADQEPEAEIPEGRVVKRWLSVFMRYWYVSSVMRYVNHSWYPSWMLDAELKLQMTVYRLFIWRIKKRREAIRRCISDV